MFETKGGKWKSSNYSRVGKTITLLLFLWS